MCGITGVLAFSDALSVDVSIVDRMRDTLVHRGPDDAGSWVDPHHRVALGHRRLSIVDLSAAGRQPMSNEDGTVWITFNGEIYNHLELREELQQRGHRYRSHTDTETIVHLYEEEGPRCVERLVGMFAFAIWDCRRRELLLARDRLGVKPLYYSHRPDGLLFGSEVKAILAHPAVVPELDEEAFFDYLTFAFVPPPRSMYAGIGKIAPAERMTVREDGSVVREEYWTPLSSALMGDIPRMADTDIVEELRVRLRRSVRRRMMSDVPYGVFLSGGLDSSTNVALLAELSETPVRTFSTAPRDFSAYDELGWARLVADRFRTDHREVHIDANDLEGFLPHLIEAEDEPLADWTAVPQHFVSRLARDSGTIVVQVGEGADEILHGYRGYADHRQILVPFQRFVPGALRNVLGDVAVYATRKAGRGIRHGEALWDAARSPLPYWGGALCFRGRLKAEILADGWAATLPASYARVEGLWQDVDDRTPQADLLQRMTYIELKQRLPELLLARLDRVAMANSIEGREPFLDHEFVEFCFAMPPHMKYRAGQGKRALREAMTGLLPADILGRKKQGFGTPMREWLREGFGQRAERAVMESTLAARGLLDYHRVAELFRAHRAGSGDWSPQLWNLYSVSVWHDRWIAGACTP